MTQVKGHSPSGSLSCFRLLPISDADSPPPPKPLQTASSTPLSSTPHSPAQRILVSITPNPILSSFTLLSLPLRLPHTTSRSVPIQTLGTASSWLPRRSPAVISCIYGWFSQSRYSAKQSYSHYWTFHKLINKKTLPYINSFQLINPLLMPINLLSPALNFLLLSLHHRPHPVQFLLNPIKVSLFVSQLIQFLLQRIYFPQLHLVQRGLPLYLLTQKRQFGLVLVHLLFSHLQLIYLQLHLRVLLPQFIHLLRLILIQIRQTFNLSR